MFSVGYACYDSGMTDAEEKELIERTKGSPLGASDFVHASEPGAREAFLNGRVLFDATPDGTRFTEFFMANRDLEPDAMKTLKANWWGSVRISSVLEDQVLITAHKTAYGQTQLQELLDANRA